MVEQRRLERRRPSQRGTAVDRQESPAEGGGVQRRSRPLIGLALLGCAAAACAAVGGAGTGVAAFLCLLSIGLFVWLYPTGSLGPELPPVRVPRALVVALAGALAAVGLVLLLVILFRLLPAVASLP